MIFTYSKFRHYHDVFQQMGLLGTEKNKIIEENNKEARQEMDKLKHQADGECDVAIPLKIPILKKKATSRSMQLLYDFLNESHAPATPALQLRVGMRL